MTNARIVATAILLALASGGTARAVTIDTTLRYSVGNFTPVAPGIPDPVEIIFSLRFDNSASFPGTTTGFQVISSNTFGPLEYAYNSEDDTLILGGLGNAFPDQCTNTLSSFCTFIRNISSENPSSNFAIQFGPDETLSSSFDEASITPFAVGAVPEPGSWALMLVGFGLAGAALRRRRPIRRTTVTYALRA